MSAAPGLLCLSGVRKEYGSAIAVDHVSLDVTEGEFVSFLGPSGSGKTTSLQMIAGFIQPSAGTVTLAEKDLTRVPPYKRDIGMVFQHYALFPHLTVAENVAFPLKMRKLPAADVRRRVDRALDQVHLAQLADRKPAQLSGGQQQRVALARAFVFEPRLLLMDEPLGALDKKLREALQTEISRLTKELPLVAVVAVVDGRPQPGRRVGPRGLLSRRRATGSGGCSRRERRRDDQTTGRDRRSRAAPRSAGPAVVASRGQRGRRRYVHRLTRAPERRENRTWMSES
jgi:ABC-type nitrate/sulfonate/bicarbonate transport system ATPase subunit